MAHGTPRINICKKCETYIEVSRFSQDPICPTCKTKSSQCGRVYDLRELYNISCMTFVPTSFTQWLKIKDIK